MARRLARPFVLALTLGLAACAGTYAVGPDGAVIQPDRIIVVPDSAERAGRRGPGTRIPPGHYPPPGSCRVWYPGRPPGQQPPPGPCNVYVPPGAVLVRG